jgi:hypothetical protein
MSTSKCVLVLLVSATQEVQRERGTRSRRHNDAQPAERHVCPPHDLQHMLRGAVKEHAAIRGSLRIRMKPA